MTKEQKPLYYINLISAQNDWLTPAREQIAQAIVTEDDLTHINILKGADKFYHAMEELVSAAQHPNDVNEDGMTRHMIAARLSILIGHFIMSTPVPALAGDALATLLGYMKTDRDIWRRIEIFIEADAAFRAMKNKTHCTSEDGNEEDACEQCPIKTLCFAIKDVKNREDAINGKGEEIIKEFEKKGEL